MKDVCVSTYCEWSSYGSIMQAIALKQALLDIGFQSFVLRDTPAPISQKSFHFKLSRNPKQLVKELLNIRHNTAKTQLYKDSIHFISKNIDIKYYNDFSALQKRPPKADYYIAGSDQVWHPSLCNRTFFLDFLPLNTKRISYAASMGNTHISPEKEEVFSKLISNFDEISVRESDMEAVIGKYTNKPIHRHIDPTFLVSASFWRALSSPYTIEKPYILVYAIYWDSRKNKELKKLHRETGCDIVALCPNGATKVWANKKIYDAHPGQFLYLIDHAEAVVSSSFHGIALSMNFNKKFAAVINPKLTSRLTSLLKLFDISPLGISEVMNFNLSSYESINSKIKKEKECSIQYLRKVLA